MPTNTQSAIAPQPFVKWVGGKRQLIPIIKEYMPKNYKAYYEPFVGGGALFFELSPSKAILNDINKALITAYTSVKDTPTALINCLKQLDANIPEEKDLIKAYFYQIRERFNKKLVTQTYDTESAALLIYLNKHCFNGLYRVNGKGLFNVPCNGSKGPSFNESNIISASRALASAHILNVDFEEACAKADEGDFVFFDSPYAPLNPTSFESYTKDGFSVEEHKRLADLFRKLTKRQCYCILTNHDTELIRELYKEFKIDRVSVKRLVNSDASNRQGTEVIIRNF